MKICGIVLTKSAMNKNGKRGACTTIYDKENRRILRLVSDKKGSPLPYPVANTFEIFDIVEAELLEYCPEAAQKENCFVRNGSVCVCGHYEDSVDALLEEISTLYNNEIRFMDDTCHNTPSIERYQHSLEIIRVRNLRIESVDGVRRTGKAFFEAFGKNYSRFSVTDLIYDIREKNINRWEIGDAYIAVSIPTAVYKSDRMYYKFIAAIYPMGDGAPVIYGRSHTDEVSYSASYSGYSPFFTVSGIPRPRTKRGIPVLQHGLLCVVKNILSRSNCIRPTQRLQYELEKLEAQGRIREEIWDTVMRYQFMLLTLAERGVLHLEAGYWKFNCKDKLLLRLAAEDLFVWFENLHILAGVPWKKPELHFSDTPDAIRIENRFGHMTIENHNAVTVRDAPRKDYYRVSSSVSIDYHIEPNIPENKKSAMKFLLRNIFHYEDFNQGQLQIITHLLNRRKTIGILPTGGGKSLCYQFAAILQPGVSFSVCPLSSLIQDQKDNLDAMGFDRSNYIISEQINKNQIMYDFAQGKYQFLWISPERLQTEQFREQIRKVHNISYAIVDEVHCLSEWGHDFRTSYLTLVPTIENYCPNTVLVGLTATASQAVLKDLKIEFNIDNFGIRALPTLQRENLTFYVFKTEDKISTLTRLLENQDMVNQSSLGIIFTTYSDKSGDADARPNQLRLKELLQQIRPDVTVEKYHSKIKNKREIQERFKRGDLNILSTTKAFGMGINKEKIRYTIHYNLPWSVEAFYQEAGRAGRGKDSPPADCYILYTPEESRIREESKILFERDTTAAQIAELQEKYRMSLRDIGDIFFLWMQNNHGPQRDKEDILTAYSLMSDAEEETDVDERRYREISSSWSSNGTDLERAVYRLKLLGMITDWTVRWQKDRKVLRCYQANSFSSDTARESVFSYIRRYDPSFGRPWTRAAQRYQEILEEQPSDTDKIEKYVMLLLQWSYDHIIYTRRRMIYNMKEFCENYTDPLSFRKRIDDFLRISDANVVLEGIVDQPFQWEQWFDVFDQSEFVDGEQMGIQLTTEACQALRETTARYLESYKDITGLNMIYCLSGALCGRFDPEMDGEIFASVLSDLSEKYNQSNSILTQLLNFLIMHREMANEKTLHTIADCICVEFPDMSDFCYRSFGNPYAMMMKLSHATTRIKTILGRSLK